jgi:TetR/AcrR family transcriptional regulator, tetracycline repressor protein
MPNDMPRSRSKAKRAIVKDKKSSGRADKSLSKKVVVAAALAEIDRHGLDNFSLRNLAKSLKVFPTAVTWYVPGRGQILAEVVKLVLSDIMPPRFYDSWQHFLRLMFEGFRDTIRRHPNVAPLIGTQLVANQAIDFDFIERLLAALSHAGFTGQRLVSAYNIVVAGMVGFSTQEFAQLPSEEIKDWREDIKERLRSLSAAKYPTLAKNMSLLRNKAFTLRWQNGTDVPLDASFAAYVDAIIKGLEFLSQESSD